MVKVEVEDLAVADSAIIRFSQQETHKGEIAALQNGRSGVKSSCDIHNLHPVLMDGVLKVGGGLSRAAMPEEMKRPVILSKEHHVSKLIWPHVHKN